MSMHMSLDERKQEKEMCSERREMEIQKWLKRVVEEDGRFERLLNPKYEEEREDFYFYFLLGLSPRQALQQEYDKKG